MNAPFRRIVASALLGLLFVSQAQAAEQAVPSTTADPNVYQLRVYMGYPVFDVNAQKPQIDTQIKVEKYFFAKSNLPAWTGKDKEKDKNTLYIASGVLHPAKDGKFSLERTFMWEGAGSGLTFGPGTIEMELDKPVELAMSMGLVLGYTAILTKVAAPTEPTSKQAETPTTNQPAASRP